MVNKWHEVWKINYHNWRCDVYESSLIHAFVLLVISNEDIFFQKEKKKKGGEGKRKERKKWRKNEKRRRLSWTIADLFAWQT